MERGTLNGQIEIESRMSELGFSQQQSNALIDCGFVIGPEDISFVTRREMFGVGFNRRDVRKIEAEFTPADLRF
jgi:hypothetical protein